VLEFIPEPFFPGGSFSAKGSTLKALSLALFFFQSRSPFTISTVNIPLLSHRLKMPHLTTNFTIPESTKTPAFKLTAVGMTLFITITRPIRFSVDANDHLTKPSYFYSVSTFTIWLLASFAPLALCEWKVQRVFFFRWVREQLLRQQPEPSNKTPPVEEDHPISFDAVMLAPYAYAVVAIIDSILGTARGDQSEQHDVATVIARASFMLCCYAIYGNMLCHRDERSGIYTHPTDSRMIAWFILMGISFVALVFSLIMGRRTFT
jgi:hypothetical protein